MCVCSYECMCLSEANYMRYLSRYIYIRVSVFLEFECVYVCVYACVCVHVSVCVCVCVGGCNCLCTQGYVCLSMW